MLYCKKKKNHLLVLKYISSICDKKQNWLNNMLLVKKIHNFHQINQIFKQKEVLIQELVILIKCYNDRMKIVHFFQVAIFQPVLFFITNTLFQHFALLVIIIMKYSSLNFPPFSWNSRFQKTKPTLKTQQFCGSFSF